MTKKQAAQVAAELAKTHGAQAVTLRKPYNFDSPSPVYFAALYGGVVGQRTLLHAGECGVTEDTVVYVDRIFTPTSEGV